MSIIGFRRWRVGRNGELRGLRDACGFVWPPAGPVLASCDCESNGLMALWHASVLLSNNANDQTPDPLDLNWPHPVRKSSCGLYGYKRPVPACQCPEPGDPRHGAVGVVRMWGRAVEHEHGWRALFAEPVAAVDFTGRLNGAYTMPRYRDLATMYGEWAPDLTAHDHEDPAWCGWQPPLVTPWISLPSTSSINVITFDPSGLFGPANPAPSGAPHGSWVFPALSAVTSRMAPPTWPNGPTVLDEAHLFPLDPGNPKQRALEARRNRGTGPRRNPFRRRGKDQRP